MNLLFYCGHPAQYHCFRIVIRELRNNGHNVNLVIKKKDILEELLIEYGEHYCNIMPEGRKGSGIGILWGLIKRDIRLYRFLKGKSVDLMIGSDPSLSHVGWVKNIPVLTFLEDDYCVIRSLARITYPFTRHIVTPMVVDVGKYKYKKIGYDGYMKLAYLHPKYFSKEDKDSGDPYFIIRLSGLNAYHDKNISGMGEELLDEIITILKYRGRIYISSEKPLPSKYDGYLNYSSKNAIHQLLAGCKLLISDSQSMSVEAAMLGVPSIRYSGLTGHLSVLEELEKKYKLTFGFRIFEKQKVLEKLHELLSLKDLVEIFRTNQLKMLSEKIDVTSFFIWLIENYPQSVEVMKENPEYQYRFR